VKSNYHTHTTWCDGRDTPAAVAAAAAAMGFGSLGFSSHAAPGWNDGVAIDSAERLEAYAGDVRSVAAAHEGDVAVFLGVEADFVPGRAIPDRKEYAAIAPDYVIGSIHYVAAPDGAFVAVDHRPDILADGIRDHFGGSAEAFVKAYFAQEREMVSRFDFDVVGHPDLVRKFNAKHPYFDETAAWYRDEIEATAEAVAASGKIVEVNTGAIARGWLDDAYPSAEFRRALRTRGVKFVLSSDAHCAQTLDCAFDRFADAEDFVEKPF